MISGLTLPPTTGGEEWGRASCLLLIHLMADEGQGQISHLHFWGWLTCVPVNDFSFSAVPGKVQDILSLMLQLVRGWINPPVCCMWLRTTGRRVSFPSPIPPHSRGGGQDQFSHSCSLRDSLPTPLPTVSAMPCYSGKVQDLLSGVLQR